MFRELVRLEVECRPRPGTERGGFGSVSSRQASTPLPPPSPDRPHARAERPYTHTTLPTVYTRPTDRPKPHARPTDRPTHTTGHGK